MHIMKVMSNEKTGSVIGMVLLVLMATAGAARAEDLQWPMAAKDYANTRYSELDQINTENAKDLKPVWTFSVGVNRGQEAAPIVVDNTMYVVTPYPNILY